MLQQKVDSYGGLSEHEKAELFGTDDGTTLASKVHGCATVLFCVRRAERVAFGAKLRRSRSACDPCQIRSRLKRDQVAKLEKFESITFVDIKLIGFDGEVLSPSFPCVVLTNIAA